MKDHSVSSKYSGHNVLTCFAEIESVDPNLNTKSQNYKFNWFKDGILLTPRDKRLNKNGEIIEIIEYMDQPQHGIVLELNDIDVRILNITITSEK